MRKASRQVRSKKNRSKRKENGCIGAAAYAARPAQRRTPMTAQQRGCRAAGRSTRRGRGHDASRVRRPNGRTAEGSRSRRAAQGDRAAAAEGAQRGRAARRRLRGGDWRVRVDRGRGSTIQRRQVAQGQHLPSLMLIKC